MPLDPALLGTPTGHGDVLVVPDPGYWVTNHRHNTDTLRAASVRMGDQTLAEWRTATRTALTGRDDWSIIVIGHQPEFIHPGVWAKHVVADRYARATGGVAVNLIVDNDVVKSPSVTLPQRKNGDWILRQVRFTSAGATTPYEYLPPLRAEDLTRMERDFIDILGPAWDASLLGVYLEGIRSDGSSRDWVQQTVAGRRAVDRAFNINMAEHRVSQLSFTPLLLDTMREPVRFARAYNEALDEYRRMHGVRDSRRPMPNLLITDGRCELPWWAVRPGLPRQRVFLETPPGHVTLFAEQVPILALGSNDVSSTSALTTALTNQPRWSIRPRAITLTLWARLLLADFFIHGIGGAKYDAVCDGIIERYFGLPPPHFAAVSATLHGDPSVRSDISAADRDARHALRDLRYNPQRHVADSAEVADLLGQRQGAINESMALARNSPADHTARRRAFHRIHAVNAEMVSRNAQLLRQYESRIAQAAHQSRQSAIALGREYFFASYPRTELERLAAALPASTDFGL